MRYSLRHSTIYSYSSAVDLSYQLAHVRLSDRPRQKVITCATKTDPASVKHKVHTDHYGNIIEIIAIVDPHARLAIVMEGEVEIEPMPPLDAGATPAWEAIAAELEGDGFPELVTESEFVHPSPMASPDPEIRAYAVDSFPPGRPVLEGAVDLTRRIFTDFRYDPTVTEVFSPLSHVMSERAGVCQDFAHLEIAMLRSLGLAARYVSGYIRTFPPAGEEGLRGADASHAWLSVWCGEAVGWVDLDPTNDLVVSDQHVVAAVGRDYGDVSPVRGVVLGGGSQQIGVNVELIALD